MPERTQGPIGIGDLQLRSVGLLTGGAARGLQQKSPLLGDSLLKLDPELQKLALRHTLSRADLLPFWEVVMEHGSPVLALPFTPPALPVRSRRPSLLEPKSVPQLIFEIPPLDDALITASRSLGKLASLLGIDKLSLSGSRLWIVYRNDGPLPFNPGSGSDQGPTAFLGLYMTFDKQLTGLTRLGWTVIDMRTPRGTLPAGAAIASSSQYQTGPGPYSGISSIDFTVTVHRTGTLKVDIVGAAGVDSSRWGKFVQDFIHKKVSNSPLFPWPDRSEKLFAEGGAAVLVTPQKALTDGDVYGITYQGKIEFGAKATAGTHRTEATADARFVIRTASVKTPLGDFNAEYSPLGVFGRGFLRYNDGREHSFCGVEGGFTSSAMVRIGRLGIGLSGEITVSTDAALQTDNPAGSRPLLSPLSEPVGSSERLGGPAGHHGTGQIVLTWTF